MTPHTIYFVRHGQTEWNVEHRVQGRLNTPLTALGVEQARKNAETLIEGIPELANLPFVSSPLGRARQTVEIIRERIGLSREGYAVDERLAELSFGSWQGLLMSEIRSRFPDDWAVRQTVKWTHKPPGGESYQQMSERVKAWLGELPGDAVVVAHGCLGRVLRGLNLGQANDDIAFASDPEHDRVYRLVDGTETVW
jgi:probable phosphoglycerate mutase